MMDGSHPHIPIIPLHNVHGDPLEKVLGATKVYGQSSQGEQATWVTIEGSPIVLDDNHVTEDNLDALARIWGTSCSIEEEKHNSNPTSPTHESP